MHYFQPLSLIVACISLPVFNISANPGGENKHSLTYTNDIYFVENKGQITDQNYALRKDIDFRIDAGNISIFIGTGQIHYQWTNYKEATDKTTTPLHNEYSSFAPSATREKDIEIYRLDIWLEGANKNVQPETGSTTKYYERYYLGHTPEEGITANAFSKIIYKDIYPGVDWVLYSQDGSLKYDFVVHPHGRASDIKLLYKGAKKLEIAEGALVVTTPNGHIKEAPPYTYLLESKEQIPCNYALSNTTVTFDVAEHDKTIVIDPVLEWATYYGGSLYDGDSKVKTDMNGFVYLAGVTVSTTNIATTGAYQTSLNSTGFLDALLVKFDSSGTRLWGTYFGGNKSDNLNALFVDPYNNIYLGGRTESGTGISTTGAHKTSLNPPQQNQQRNDGFFAKFNTNGQRLYSTYYGGLGDDEINAITADSNYVYIAGLTFSDTGIATGGTHQTNYIDSTGFQNGNIADGFVAKFSHAGTRTWGTYYGGAGSDVIYKLGPDLQGNIVIGGGTTSDTGIASTNAYDKTNGTTLPGSYMHDAFLAKLDANGLRVWGTYYGGSGVENVLGLTIDNTGNIYIGGNTTSTDSIASANSKNPTIGDGYVAKFNDSGFLVWGQYISIVDVQIGNKHYFDIAKDTRDHIYVAGTSVYDADKLNPCFNQYIPQNPNYAHSMFLIVYDTSGSIFLSNVFAGNLANYATGVATYGEDCYYFSAVTNSSNMATINAHQTTMNGNSDLFLAKYTIDTNVFLEQPFKDTLLCTGDTINLKYVVTKQFKPGNIFSIQLSDSSGNFTTTTTIGSATGVTGGNINCIIPNNISPSGNYRIRIVSTNPAITPCAHYPEIGIGINTPDSFTTSGTSPVCRKDTIELYATSTSQNVHYTWRGPGNFFSNDEDPTIPGIDTQGTFQYSVKAGVYGCYSYDTVTIVVKPLPGKPTAQSNSPICVNDSLKLSAATITTGVTYSWSGPNNFNSTAQNPAIPNATPTATGSYITTAHLNGCSLADTVAVTVKPLPANTSASTNSPICAIDDTLKLFSSSSSNGISYNWTGPNNFSSSQQNPVLINPATSASGDYINTIALNGCTVSDTLNVVIKVKPSITTSSNSPVCLGHSINLTSTSIQGGVYTWHGPNNFSSTVQNPVISNVISAMAGTYHTIVTQNGCKSDTATTIVTIASSTPTPTGGSNSPLCAGQSLYLTASAIPGASYTWWGSSSFSSNLQNPARTNATLNYSGEYYVTASINNCISDTDTVVVVVNPAPFVNIAPLSGTDICHGEEATFLATGSNSGANPQYQWLINGLQAGVSSTLFKTTNLSNGDIVSCEILSTDVCGSPYRDTSNGISITVHPKLAPTVNITANPSTPLFPNEPVIFNAITHNAGNAPQYQWKRNGASVIGATGSIWGANANFLQDGDEICVWIKSNYKCPNPDTALSNCINVQIKVTVEEISGMDNISVYPNPFNEGIHINNPGNKMSISLYDIVGRVVYSATSTTKNHKINTTDILPGHYILKVTDQYGKKFTFKVLKE